MIVYNLLVVVVISTFLTSCVIVTGLDPAEKLSTMIEVKSKELRSSNKESLEFKYSPNIHKIKKSPKYDGTVSIAARVTKKDIGGHSTIQVANWYTTSYHNRFVRVSQAMERIKKTGEFFRIILIKNNNGVVWSAIK